MANERGALVITPLQVNSHDLSNMEHDCRGGYRKLSTKGRTGFTGKRPVVATAGGPTIGAVGRTPKGPGPLKGTKP
jgi:hypothetical protein